MTLLVDKLTSIVIPTYFWFIQMSVIETKFGAFCIQTFNNMKTLSWVIEIWMENHLVSDNKSTMPNFVYKSMRNDARCTFYVGDNYIGGLRLLLGKGNGVGDT